jgi:hypothetical protein
MHAISKMTATDAAQGNNGFKPPATCGWLATPGLMVASIISASASVMSPHDNSTMTYTYRQGLARRPKEQVRQVHSERHASRLWYPQP